MGNTRHVTTDGLERTLAVNHLAPFLLTSLLLAQLEQSGHARVVTNSSHAHSQGRIDFDDLQCERSYSGARLQPVQARRRPVQLQPIVSANVAIDDPDEGDVHRVMLSASTSAEVFSAAARWAAGHDGGFAIEAVAGMPGTLVPR